MLSWTQMRIKFSYSPQPSLQDYISLEAEGTNILAQHQFLEETFCGLLQILGII